MSNIIIRTVHLPNATIGQLEIEGEHFRCFTLELPDLDNAKNISCIPAGTYKYEKRDSPSLGRVIHLLDVENRTWIYIHAGNYTSQIQGCILVGDSVTDMNGDGIPDVTRSIKVFQDLMGMVEDKGTVAVIRG